MKWGRLYIYHQRHISLYYADILPDWYCIKGDLKPNYLTRRSLIVKLFTLIYCEHPLDERAEDTINGPYIFTEYGDAIDCVSKYVYCRLPYCCFDEFIENVSSLNINPALCRKLRKSDQKNISNLLEKASLDDKEKIIDWFFGFANDDTVEAFYAISELGLPILANNLYQPTEIETLDVDASCTGRPGESTSRDDDKTELYLELLMAIHDTAGWESDNYTYIAQKLDIETQDVHELFCLAKHELKRINQSKQEGKSIP